MESVDEGSGTVQVCATLSIVSEASISVSLATNDSLPGTYCACFLLIIIMFKTCVCV